MACRLSEVHVMAVIVLPDVSSAKLPQSLCASDPLLIALQVTLTTRQCGMLMRFSNTLLTVASSTSQGS